MVQLLRSGLGPVIFLLLEHFSLLETAMKGVVFWLISSIVASLVSRSSAASTPRVKRPLLLISCDGFRADKFDNYLSSNPNSSFRSLVSTGVRAEFMK